jgi:hypothetical protein
MCTIRETETIWPEEGLIKLIIILKLQSNNFLGSPPPPRLEQRFQQQVAYRLQSSWNCLPNNEANSCSVTEDILRHLWNPKVDYSAHQTPQIQNPYVTFRTTLWGIVSLPSKLTFWRTVLVSCSMLLIHISSPPPPPTIIITPILWHLVTRWVLYIICWLHLVFGGGILTESLIIIIIIIIIITLLLLLLTTATTTTTPTTTTTTTTTDDGNNYNNNNFK